MAKVDPASSRPNIAKLFEAFNRHKTQIRLVLQGQPGTWANGFKEAGEELRVELAAFGIADHFDWADEDLPNG